MLEIDSLTIGLAALIGTMIQSLWVSSLLFGKFFPTHTKQQKIMSGVGSFLSLFVLSWCIAFLEVYLDITSFWDGIVAGFGLGIGVVFMSSFPAFLWKKEPVKLFLLSQACQIVTLMGIGGVLAG